VNFEEENVNGIRRVFLAVAFLALAIGVVLPSGARAQGLASLNGTVTDSSGATVPAASVKLENAGTGITFSTQTASDGGYRFVDVPPGPAYSLTVTKSGFQTLVLSGIYLPTATATTKDAQLSIGQVSQTVEVTAETGSVSLNTTDSTIGTALDMNAVANLPDEIRDDPGSLLRLSVGVTNAQSTTGNLTSSNEDVDHTRDGSVAGARADENNIFVDGVDATDTAIGQPFATVAAIPVDAIQEFSTQVAEPSAAYGGHSGAQTLITTKSGNNTWHGTAYEYNRTAATEANTFFNKLATPEIPRLPLVRNQYGGNVGGPVLKDKLFFFFEYDGRRDPSAESIHQLVPAPWAQDGIIKYRNNSLDGEGPMGASGCATARLTSATDTNSCISTASASEVVSLDPCSVDNCSATPGFVAAGPAPAILNLFKNRYPAPNDYSTGDGLNIFGLRFNAPNALTETGYVARVDYSLSSNNKLFGRFNLQNVLEGNNNVGVFPIQFPSDPLTATQQSRDRGWVFGDTWILTPNLINQFTYGETRQSLQDPVNAPQAGNLYELGWFGSFAGATLATPYDRQTSSGRVVPNPTFRDDITYTRGKHTIAFGGQFNPAKVRTSLINDFDFISEGIGGEVSALQASEQPADITNDSTSQNLWNNFFAGDLGLIWDDQTSINYTKSGTALPPGSGDKRDWRLNNVAWYVQDSWRIRPDLTATYGLRYQYQDAPYEVHGIEAQFFNTNFNQIVNTRVANGLAGISGPDATPQLTYQLAGKVNGAPPLYHADKKDFSPRLALAWNPSYSQGLFGKAFGDRKTVVRAGGALIFDPAVVYAVTNFEDQSNYIFGNSFSEEFGGGPGEPIETEPRFNAVNKAPFTITAPAFVNPLTPQNPGGFNEGIDPNLKTPYSITASFGLQRELPGGFQLEADYYGRFSRRLIQLSDVGQAIDFTDPASKQTLVQAYSALEEDARMGPHGLPASSVVNQPFFENQMAGSGVCTPSCTYFVYKNFQPDLQNGGTGLVQYILDDVSGLMPANVGMTSQFAVNALIANKTFADYNGLFVIVRKRLSNNLQFDFNYAFSHSIDNGSAIGNDNGNFDAGSSDVLCDVTNNKACRGNSEFDITHQISADFVYDLPFGRGQMIGRNSNWLVNEAIGGWSVAGIETWHTGFAYSANDTDNAAYDTVSLAADTGVLFDGKRSALKENIHFDPVSNGMQLYANPTAAAAQFTYVTGLQSGDRDTLRGPHFSNLDLSVSKNFPLKSERYHLKLVAEAYNVFNHPNFGFGDTGIYTGSFGIISGQVGSEPSRVMQFALRFQF
jgi:hypothetical protein